MRKLAVVCACLALGPGAASASAADWLAPEDISGLSESITTTPQVAMDGAGNAVATIVRDAGGGDILVEALERPAGGEWSGPVVLSDPDEEEPTTTQVAVDAAGNAVAVWGAWVNPGYAIQTASRPAGGAWSEPEPLDESPFLGARPQLAMNAAGDAVATWQGFDANEVVVAASLPAGGEWSEPEEISDEMAGFSQVGIDAEGNATAVWQLADPGENVIRTASRPAAGDWSEPEDLSAAGDNATAPRIAVDGAGNAVAVWSVTSGDVGVHARRRPAGGVWSAQKDVSADGEAAGEPEVAIDSNGAVAIWTATVGDDQILRGAAWPAGAAEWSAPANVSAPVDQFRSLDLETDAAAGAIATWTRSNGPDNSVQASVRPPGGDWSDPEDLSAEGREAGLADLAFDPAGNAIALWGAAVEDDFVVQASGYDFVAPRLADVRIPATAKVGEPVGFSVSPFDVFPLGATSWSFGDGSSANGNAVSHVYAEPGAYPVTLSVVDRAGNTNTRTAAIAIAAKPPPPPEDRLTALILRIGKKSLQGLRRSGTLAVTAAVDGAATATLDGRLRLRAKGRKARVRLVRIFAPETVSFAAEGEQTVQLTLSERGRKKLRQLTKARIRIEGEASDLANVTVTDSAARTLR
jgi:hypothetical protein